METVLVTGTAGFIGYHTAERLLREGCHVIGIDDMNDYYDPALKRARLSRLQVHQRFTFVEGSITEQAPLDRAFDAGPVTHVIHLAAQAGVRYSIERPDKYIASNITGFMNILEACRDREIAHLVYASSSSVYGANVTMPFRTTDAVDHPVSLYAATKKSNELMAHTYSHLFGLPTTGLRFFTVYGPWGRPDMAYFSFTQDILEGKTVRLFNNGEMRRDFTYIDDIVEGVVRVMRRIPAANPDWDRASPNPGGSDAPYKLYNIGNNEPVALLEFLETIEDLVGVKARIEYAPMQPGDVRATYADISELQQDVGFRPSTPLREGLSRFVAWYREFYSI